MYITVDEMYYRQLIDKAIRYDCIVQELLESKGFDITFLSKEDYQHYYDTGLDKRPAIRSSEVEKIISNSPTESPYCINDVSPIQDQEPNIATC